MAKTSEYHHMHFVLTKKEYEVLCANAKKAGLTKKAYLCRLIMNKPVSAAKPLEPIKQLYTEINHIGNNINQIARSVNAGIAEPDSAAAQALMLLKKVYALMEKAADG